MVGGSEDAERVETPHLEEQMGISDLPEDVVGHDGCPKASPDDPDHNCHTTQKIVATEDDEGNETLELLLHLQCSCGHERRETI